MPTDEERIQALEQELAQLRDKTGTRPLTLAEIRCLSPEQARERWKEVKRGLREAQRESAGDDERDAKRGEPARGKERRGEREKAPTPLRGVARIAAGLEAERQRREAEEGDR